MKGEEKRQKVRGKSRWETTEKKKKKKGKKSTTIMPFCSLQP